MADGGADGEMDGGELRAASPDIGATLKTVESQTRALRQELRNIRAMRHTRNTSNVSANSVSAVYANGGSVHGAGADGSLHGGIPTVAQVSPAAAPQTAEAAYRTHPDTHLSGYANGYPEPQAPADAGSLSHISFASTAVPGASVAHTSFGARIAHGQHRPAYMSTIHEAPSLAAATAPDGTSPLYQFTRAAAGDGSLHQAEADSGLLHSHPPGQLAGPSFGNGHHGHQYTFAGGGGSGQAGFVPALTLGGPAGVALSSGATPRSFGMAVGSSGARQSQLYEHATSAFGGPAAQAANGAAEHVAARAQAQAAAAERELMNTRGMLVHEVTAREHAAVENDRLRMDVARLTGEVSCPCLRRFAPLGVSPRQPAVVVTFRLRCLLWFPRPSAGASATRRRRIVVRVVCPPGGATPGQGERSFAAG